MNERSCDADEGRCPTCRVTEESLSRCVCCSLPWVPTGVGVGVVQIQTHVAESDSVPIAAAAAAAETFA